VVVEDRLGKVTLAAGARLDLRHLSADANATLGNPADTRDYTAGSGTVGIVYEASPGLSFRSNLGLSWRAPNLFELYANGPHLGEARYERGDSSLSTERGLVFDLGARLDRPGVRLDGGIYSQHIRDYIYITPTAEVIDGFQVYQHVSGTGELYGFEGEVDVDLTRSLTARLRGDARPDAPPDGGSSGRLVVAQRLALPRGVRRRLRGVALALHGRRDAGDVRPLLRWRR
jgi:outer membrane receptor protein involved in Fe transport